MGNPTCPSCGERFDPKVDFIKSEGEMFCSQRCASGARAVVGGSLRGVRWGQVLAMAAIAGGGYGAFLWLNGEPKIEQRCTMNGFGAGTCTFTNVGDGSGTVCGHIVVSRTGGGSDQSGPLCSGNIEPSSTKNIEFNVPSTNELCSGNGKWSDVCSFTFQVDSSS